MVCFPHKFCPRTLGALGGKFSFFSRSGAISEREKEREGWERHVLISWGWIQVCMPNVRRRTTTKRGEDDGPSQLWRVRVRQGGGKRSVFFADGCFDVPTKGERVTRHRHKHVRITQLVHTFVRLEVQELISRSSPPAPSFARNTHAHPPAPPPSTHTPI